MTPPRRDDPKGKGKAFSSNLSVQNPPQPSSVNYRPFLNASCLSNYMNYYSKRPIAIEQHMHEKTLFDTLIRYMLVSGGWESLMTIKGEVQEEAVWVF